MVTNAANGLSAPADLLDAAERGDPRGHVLHASLMFLWACLLSITPAGEGIAWGLLAAITILRLPRIWWCYLPVWRDPLWWVLTSWFAWSWLTTLWGPDAMPVVASGVPDRWLFTPLLVWPTMSRPWLPLIALAVGGVAHAFAALCLSWNGGGWGTYGQFQGLAQLSTLQWQFLAPWVLCAVAIRWCRGPLRAVAVIGLLASGTCIWLMAMRNGIIAAVAALSAVAFRPPPLRARLVPWLLCVAVCVLAVLASPAMQRLDESFELGSRLRESNRSLEADAAAPGGRWLLLQAAWDIGREHPWLGGGAGWFATRLPQWVLARAAWEGVPPDAIEGLMRGKVIHVHSTPAHEWVDGGIPSVLLLGTFLAGLASRLWCQSRSSRVSGAALAVFVVVLLHAPLGIITLRMPGALMAICMATAWLGQDRGRA